MILVALAVGFGVVLINRYRQVIRNNIVITYKSHSNIIVYVVKV